ncbi:hypothetical protein C3L33_17193, partial [Rhododendron williamsianum]
MMPMETSMPAPSNYEMKAIQSSWEQPSVDFRKVDAHFLPLKSSSS